MRNSHILLHIILLALFINSLAGLFGQSSHLIKTYNSAREKQRYTYPGYYIVIRKDAYTLSLYHGSRLIKEYQCAIGLNPGDKQREHDYRTPEGNFYICSIENSTYWMHDFLRDGKGPVKDAYGPWFFRLYTGADSTNSGRSWRGFAIHGTHDPASIGTNASEGCIRLRNEDILDLKPYIKKGMPVRIEA